MVKGFVISAHRRDGSGPTMYFARKKFTTVDRPTRFKTLHRARTIARRLIKHFAILADYEIRVFSSARDSAVYKMNPLGFLTLLQGASATKSLTQRSSNPSARMVRVKRAAKLLTDFSGHAPSEIVRFPTNDIKEGLVVGSLDGVPYTTIRDGKTEHYIHEFKKHARPLLIASSDGRKLGIVGGRFQFTEAGIVDDPAH